MNHPTAEILSQGDEVITGEIVDTNSTWLARELSLLGFDMVRHVAVGDRLQEMSKLLREIAARSDLCICTGGLGPTCDDLTTEAICSAFGMHLRLDSVALRQIESFFLRMGRGMPEINRKQAYLPEGARRIDNRWGTAPGFALRAERCCFIFLPGVPEEMKAMFEYSVRDDLIRSFSLCPSRLVVLRTVGIGESALQEKIDQIGIPSTIRLGFQAGEAENRVKLLFPIEFSESSIAQWVARVASVIGDEVYCIAGMGGEEADLRTLAGQALVRRAAHLYAIETVSGGQLAQSCAGESWFLGALVAPGRDALSALLGIEATQDVADLAKLAKAWSGADFVLAQVGSDAAEIPDHHGMELGLALAGPDGVRTEYRRIVGNRQRRQNLATAWGLDALRRWLG